MNLSETMPTLQVVALGVNALLVLVIFPLRKAVDDLSNSDRALTERLQALEIKIAEQYVQRGELSVTLDKMLLKLDQIDARINSRMDSLDAVKVNK